MTTYGPQGATQGERCSNITATYTCPGCYTDYDKPVTSCTRCAAPLRCYTEQVPHYQCEIAGPDKDDEDEP